MQRNFLSIFILIFLAVFLSTGAIAGDLLSYPKFKAFDSNGDPLSGGKLYTYIAGTTTAKASYSDNCSTANANPVVLDSDGEATVYLCGSYKLVLKDSDDVTIWTMDNVSTSGDIGGDFYYPNATATDQGITGNNDTLKYFVDTCSTNDCTIYFRHDGGGASTTYTLTTSESIPANIKLIFEYGAILDGAGTLTVASADQILTGRNQLFGSSITLSLTNESVVFPEWWGENSTQGTTDMTAEIQAAVTCVGGIGTEGELGQGGSVSLAGTYKITSAITIVNSGVYIFGNGMNATEIVNAGTNTHALHFAPSDPVNYKRHWGGVENLTISYSGSDPTAGAAIYIDRYTHVKIEQVHLRDNFQGVAILGDGQTIIDNSYIMQGTNTSAIQSGSAGIYIARRQVVNTDPNGLQDSADSLYYTEPNSVYISNTNIRNLDNGSTQYYGYDDGIYVNAVDGLYLDNLHMNGGATAGIRFYPVQTNMPVANLHAAGVFVDPITGFGNYGIYYQENAALASSLVQDHTWVGLECDNADLTCVELDDDWTDITFSGGILRNAEDRGLEAQDGEELTVSGIVFTGNDKGENNRANLTLTNVNDATVTGCVFDGAYFGVAIKGTSARNMVTGNVFSGQTGVNINQAVYLNAANITSNKVIGNNSDNSTSVASASNIEFPVEHDVINITGTTTITSIDSDNETNGYAGFDGKIVTLKFAGALQVSDGNNLNLIGNFKSAADDTLTLAYYGENWYEVARSSPGIEIDGHVAETDAVPANSIYRFEVYDRSGNSLGWVPIYNAW